MTTKSKLPVTGGTEFRIYSQERKKREMYRYQLCIIKIGHLSAKEPCEISTVFPILHIRKLKSKVKITKQEVVKPGFKL